MSKYEQLIEFIINEQEDKARELFHQIVVEKSREIYESIIDEEDLEEIGGNPVADMMDEVTMDEQGMAEAEADDAMAMDMDSGDDELDVDIDVDDEEGDMEMDMDAEESPEMAVSDAREEVDAIFSRLMSQLSGEDQDMDNMDNMDNIDGMDADDEEDFDSDEDLQESKHAKKEEMLKDKGAKDKEAKDKEEAKGKRKMTEAEWLREYVDQIGDVYSQEPAQEEGHEVGHGKKVKVDKDSTAVGPGVIS